MALAVGGFIAGALLWLAGVIVGAHHGRSGDEGDPARILLIRRLVMVLSVGMCGWGIVVLLAWPKDAFLQQIGAALLQTGLATLFIGYVGFELLVDERLPRALFGHGYFRVANNAERVRLLRSSIGALA